MGLAAEAVPSLIREVRRLRAAERAAKAEGARSAWAVALGAAHQFPRPWWERFWETLEAARVAHLKELSRE